MNVKQSREYRVALRGQLAGVQDMRRAIRVWRMSDTDFWSQHPDHPLKVWQYEVANGYTRHGYWEWAANRELRAIDGGATKCT